MIACLDDPDRKVRGKAVRAPGQIRETIAIDPLLRRLDDPYPDFSYEVCRALDCIGWNKM